MREEFDRVLASVCSSPRVRLQFAVCDAEGLVEEVIRGTWPDGSPVRATDRFYTASLAKQVTGAATAILVRDGRLDPDFSVARYLPDLPGWANDVTTRHLLHHMAGLPGAGEVEASESDWTEAFALASVRGLPHLAFEPNAAYVYSNVGYVLLARVIAQAAGCDLQRFAATCLFEPFGLTGMEFQSTFPGTSRQLGLMGPGLPLTVGDGGLWSTAGDFSKWLHLQNRDVHGIANLVTAPGRSSSGDTVPYGWGLGLRHHHGRPLFVHGGEWTGAVAKSVRSPSTGIAIAALASGVSMEELNTVVTAALNWWSKV